MTPLTCTGPLGQRVPTYELVSIDDRAMNAAPISPPDDRLGRNYRRLFGAATISNLGDGVALVAYPWLASAITRNPLLIAIVVVVQRLPWLLFALAGRRAHRPPRSSPADDRRQRGARA